MGISILELVLELLREAGFVANAAYPGQKYPQITEPVAAVHISRVNRAELTVTMEVNIICPGEMGGVQAELEALRATQALRWQGAECIQQGCVYDGAAQVYMVTVEVTFTGIAGEEDFTPGPGFAIFINDTWLPYAVRFEAEKAVSRQVYYEMGEAAPIGMDEGSWIWNIRLEELIPHGGLEISTGEPFKLKVSGDMIVESYSDCRWNSVSREMTREGIRRIRTGIAMEKGGGDE